MTQRPVDRLPANSGVAIGPLLFIIAILGFVTAAIATDSGTFTAGTKRDGVPVLASSVLAYQGQVMDAVQLALGHGCEPTQISFENPKVDGYANASAPATGKCHVFNPQGGRALYVAPPADALDTGGAASEGYGRYTFTGTYKVAGIGSDYPLMMLLPFVRQDVAEKINTMLGVSGTLETEADCDSSPGPFAQSAGNFFTGAFNAGTCAGGSGEIGAAASSALKGKLMGCYPTSVGSPYTCYAVLLVR